MIDSPTELGETELLERRDRELERLGRRPVGERSAEPGDRARRTEVARRPAGLREHALIILCAIHLVFRVNSHTEGGAGRIGEHAAMMPARITSRGYRGGRGRGCRSGGDRAERRSPYRFIPTWGSNIKQMTPHAVVEMAVTEAVRGSMPGSVHGGMLATLADVACAVSLWGNYEFPGEMPVTTDMHVRYYRQPRSSPVTAEARMRASRSDGCSAPSARSPTPMAAISCRATATYMIVEDTYS